MPRGRRRLGEEDDKHLVRVAGEGDGLGFEDDFADERMAQRLDSVAEFDDALQSRLAELEKGETAGFVPTAA